MSPLILASQSQALPLLLLPLALSGGHSGMAAKRVHAHAQTQVVSAQPLLYPVNIVTCSGTAGDGWQSAGHPLIDLDPRLR